MIFCKEKIYAAPTHGMFVASGSESVAELAAGAGFDWLLFDLEHGLGDEAALLRQLRACRGTGTAPLVRIPALRAEAVKRVLDLGVSGVMAPMVRDAAAARELVTAMRYPPEGIRGLSSGSRAADYGAGFRDYFGRANRELLGIVQIECASALDDADAIAALDGVDVLFIGHSDLSLALGCYGEFESPRMLAAEQKVLAAARTHGKVAGMLLKAGMDAEVYRRRGFRFFAHGTDLGILRGALGAVVARIRAGSSPAVRG